MLDDEEHLIVVGRLGRLGRQQSVKVQIAGIGHRIGQVGPNPWLKVTLGHGLLVLGQVQRHGGEPSGHWQVGTSKGYPLSSVAVSLHGRAPLEPSVSERLGQALYLLGDQEASLLSAVGYQCW